MLNIVKVDVKSGHRHKDLCVPSYPAVVIKSSVPTIYCLTSQVTVAGLCRDSGYLFSCGVVTQLGSAVGALVMFLLVNKVGSCDAGIVSPNIWLHLAFLQVNLFESYYPSC